MFRDNGRSAKLEQVASRGAELSRSFPDYFDLIGLYHYYYMAYAVTLDNQTYRMAQRRTRGNVNSKTGTYEPRDNLIIAFTPEPQHNLRFIPGVEEITLPTFTVWHEPTLGYRGTLRFDRKAVERVHWWSRLIDRLNYPSELLVAQEFVGSSKGADRILDYFTEALEATPTAITPINPSNWKEIARQYEQSAYVV